MENYTRWDDFLVAEHEMIERAMAVLKNNLERIDTAVKKPLQMQRAIDFLLEFGDKMHNTREEKFLFPLMGEKGLPIEGGPIGVMLMEHDAERHLLQRMMTELPGLAEASAAGRQKFAAEGFEYLKVRAEHIWKENDVLYAMGRKVFSEEENASLLHDFTSLDRQTYGPEAREHYNRMLVEVEKDSEAKKRLIQNLSYEQIDAILETLPFEVTFVDAQDTVAYFNKLDKTKLFPRTRSVIGRKVDKCHPEKSVDTVLNIVNGFKDGTMDHADFWIDFRGDKILIRYYPVHNEAGEYMGVLEVTQAIGAIQKIEGEKRLLY
ncbi:MAG: PAS domain-containing protein [Desulfobulbales bacterium]|nr:PAS domain-containing protein [Desulfobulbales bacterium]